MYKIYGKNKANSPWIPFVEMYTFLGAIEYVNKSGFILDHIKDGEWFYMKSVSPINEVPKMFLHISKMRFIMIKEVMSNDIEEPDVGLGQGNGS